MVNQSSVTSSIQSILNTHRLQNIRTSAERSGNQLLVLETPVVSLKGPASGQTASPFVREAGGTPAFPVMNIQTPGSSFLTTARCPLAAIS
jgi:hypothetical protein